MLFNRTRTRVSCHFCNSTLHLVPHSTSSTTHGQGKGKEREGDQLAHGTRNDWTCSVCDQRNQRHANGELVSSQPAMHSSDLNRDSFARRASPGPSLTAPTFARTPLCRACLSNASLQVHLLAAFPSSSSSSSDSDSEDTSLPHLLPEYRHSLDQRYPLICANCQGAVDEVLKQSDYRAKAYALGARLRESQKGAGNGGGGRGGKSRGKRRTGGWAWTAMGLAWRVRGTAFWSTHVAGLLVSGIGAATPNRLLLSPPLPSWIPLLCALSLLWSFWDPTWNHVRNERARGRHPRVVGRQLFIIIQMSAFVCRFGLAVVLSREWIASPTTMRNVASGAFLILFSALLASFLTIRILPPSIVRLHARTNIRCPLMDFRSFLQLQHSRRNGLGTNSHDKSETTANDLAALRRAVPTRTSTPTSGEKAHFHYAETCCGSRFASPPTYDDAVKPSAPLPLSAEEIETLETAIDGLDGELRKLSLTIHDNPEIAWKEFKTHDVLCDFMESHGFKVTRHAYGLETAWEATFEHGSGGPVVGFNSEMDALPGIGHACGHNLIAIAGVAASLGVAAALKKHNVAGKVILLGTPAEEGDGGKINLLRAGAYKPMGACFMLHPAPYSEIGSSLAVAECVVEYTGHTAHAAGAPWEAINAQDAAVLAYNNISVLRQQTHPTHRLHGIIINENWVQNVIPGSSKVVFGVRAPTMAEVEVLKVKVAKCFEAAALATGCDYKNNWVMSYADLRNSGGLAGAYTDYMSTRFAVKFPVKTDLGGSTDFGNVSYAVPALHPGFQIPCGPGEGNHTVGFTKAASLPESHKLTLDAAKGISVAAWKFVTDADFSASVKQEFEKMKESL
ncbi:hypothetical protein RQP46_003172 [Phenoliferia psychrophenolica]